MLRWPLLRCVVFLRVMSKLSLEKIAFHVERAISSWFARPWWLLVDLADRDSAGDGQVPPPADVACPADRGDSTGASARRAAKSAVRIPQIQATASAITGAQSKLKILLLQPEANPTFKEDVLSTGRSLAEVVARNPDGALFHLMHEASSKFAIYSVVHSMQCAVACGLVAERLGWSEQQRDSLLCAGLTMNIGMAKVQGELALQSTPPTPQQRQAIQEHPLKSAELLQSLGVTNADWLRAVREHHETPDGTGYPNGISAAFEPAEVLRHVDIFMAKLKSRASRKAIPPSQAVCEIFVNGRNNRIAAAVIKEFGLYPPGIFVRLANGEVAIAVARGNAVNKPIVAVLMSRSGEAPVRSIRRDTTEPRYAVVSVINGANVMAEVDPRKLYA